MIASRAVRRFSGGIGRCLRRPRSLRGAVEVLVEFAQVVGGGHQSPFGAGGGASAAVEADEPAVVFDVAEDRLDQLAALLVERGPDIGGEHEAHEVVGAAVPSWPARLVGAAA